MLWLDKYRPNTLNNVDYHKELSLRLINLAKSDNVPHLLFYGPSGSGKKTRVLAFLRELFGKGSEKIRQDQRIFKTPSRKTVEVNTLNSNYHIEINPSDAGNADTFVVQEIIKEIAQSSPLHTLARHRKEQVGTEQSQQRNKAGFKVVIISEADSLSKAAQHALRRTMERYISGCRLILISEAMNRLIPALKSRCLNIRVPAPTQTDMLVVAKKVLKNEENSLVWNNSTEEVCKKILAECNRNMRRGLLMLQTSHSQYGSFNGLEAVKVPLPDWENFISAVTKKIIQGQSPQALLEVRKDLYELLGSCVPPTMIIQTLCYQLLRKVDIELRQEIINAAAFYDCRLRNGTKSIFHIEAFVAKVMFLYKQHLVNYFE